MNKLYTFLFLVFTCISTQAQEWEPVSTVIDDFRTDHTFGFSIDGVGYLVTGSDFGGTVLASFYSYDVATDTWTRKTDFPGGARGFGIGHVYNGKAYFGFGLSATSERLDDLWVYDPADDTWTELTSCDCSGRIHPAMTIVNDVLYITMGGGDTGNLNDHWAYDLNIDTWSQKANFPAAPRHHPYQFVLGDYIYAGFGHGNNFISNEWYRYDATDDTWEQVKTLQAEGRVAGTQFDYNGKGYVLSGDGDDHNSMETGEFWEYDAENDTWTELPPHPGWSRWAPASFIIDGWVYLIGGWTANLNGSPGYPSTNWKFPLGLNTSSKDIASKTEFDIHPNPTSGMVYIPNELVSNSSASIFDSTGKLVSNVKVNSPSIDISNLDKGIYFLEIIDENGNYNRSKIIME